QTQAGNVVLHAWNIDRNEHRSYRVDRIEGPRTTNQRFNPRYAIELTPTGPGIISPAAAPVRTPRVPAAGSFRAFPPAPPRSRARSTNNPFQPTYVYECPYCQKKFRRKTQTSTLNAHKQKNGYPCPGRSGVLIGTEY